MIPTIITLTGITLTGMILTGMIPIIRAPGDRRPEPLLAELASI